jgi:hypothetical protein
MGWIAGDQGEAKEASFQGTGHTGDLGRAPYWGEYIPYRPVKQDICGENKVEMRYSGGCKWGVEEGILI